MTPAAEPETLTPVDLVLQTLQASGAAAQDPIGLHYLQSLHAKMLASAEPLRPLLEARLTHALAEFEKRNGTGAKAKGITETSPVTSEPLEPLASSKPRRPHLSTPSIDSAASPRAAAATSAVPPALGPLRKLTLEIQRPSQVGAVQGGSPIPKADPSKPSVPAKDASALHYFRTTWTRLRTGKKLAQALQQAPKNAGPINSHNLVLRSLALMQDISPDYLNRFVVHVDALLSLDASAATPIKTAKTSKTAKVAAVGKTVKRRKSP